MNATALIESPPLAGPTLDDPEARFEIIDDVPVELPPMGANEGRIGFRLAFALGSFAQAHGLGEAITEVRFDLRPAVNRRRCPDAAFVAYERWPKGRPIPPGADWPVVPDLAVEVVSLHDKAADLAAKIGEYFRAGVRLVWVVYPGEALVYAYESPTRVRILTRAEDLDGGTALPGFTLPLASLLDDPDAA